MLDKLAEFVIFGFAPLIVGALVMPIESRADEKVITGEVVYRERIALPPSAVLTVQLVDETPTGEPGAIIGQQTIANAGQAPIKFEISFDPVAIRPGTKYALEANITVDHTLWFENDERYQLDPLTAGPQTLTLKMVNKTGSQSMLKKSGTFELPAGIFDTIWLAEDIEGRGVIDDAQSTFKVSSDGSVSGRGGCNSYFGKATVEGNSIKVSDIASTFMACAPALMDQEKKLFSALGKAASFRLNEGKLYLADNEGRDVLRFASQG
ncbi:META domain-containing protein [Pseudaminobacter soli (ex Li et al. 2025)]|uniref:DUF306 domain-containing protein n=1 Tax=Pseudaminobacter soli (ex Li et al. 2025) TaxID=1295366 RepID=A0A2P7SFF3_9HYPH|nr:META domain-containing protein [Mesorhizobium soli]PSJ61213.1 hypothetical protein C7I85_08995 [Mesorhizobium soli]